MGMRDACAAHASMSRRRIGGCVPVAPACGARVRVGFRSPYAVDAPARDAGAASLLARTLKGQRWMPSGAAKSSRTRTDVPFLQHRRASRQRWLRAGRMALGSARFVEHQHCHSFWIQHTRGRDGLRAAPAHIALVRIIAFVHCTAKRGLESLRANLPLHCCIKADCYATARRSHSSCSTAK